MRIRPAARLSPEALLARLLVTPHQPCPRMMRATRLREVATPDASGRMGAFGAPSGLLAHW